MTITVHKVDDDTFEVTVLSVKKTSHLVTISDETHQKLTDSRTSKETLLDYSFKFLLEREPNTAIMSSFELTVISEYFPEYEDEVRNFFQISSSGRRASHFIEASKKYDR